MSKLKRLWRNCRLSSSSGDADNLPIGISEEDFDADWYLQAYPDVAKAGINPWRHFTEHGQREGRLPCANRAVAYEYHLWRGAGQLVLPRLRALVEDAGADVREAERAARALEHWEAGANGKGSFGISEEVGHHPSPLPYSGYRGCATAKPSSPKGIVQQSGWFDPLWYLEQYADLVETTADPFEHFWHIGAAEGRDPGPGFSTSGYLRRYPDAAEFGCPALAHYLLEGREKGYEALVEFPGERSERTGAPTLLVCAHQAGKYLYGAERSLLDILTGFDSLPVNLVVTLPNVINCDYLEAVRGKARAVVVLPYGWWNAERHSNNETQSQFEFLIDKFNVSALYANTLVLDEPLLAARARNIPAVVHVRELPAQDVALCRTLKADATEIVERVKRLADLVVVNSTAVARAMGVAGTVVVPNTVDADQYELSGAVGERENDPIRVALISSNLPKKGLEDFVLLAGLLEEQGASIQCLLIGQGNEHIRLLRARQLANELPGNLLLAGYAPTPQAALAQADIVVNLSRFQESFGRTVLEAMAAARPVVAYAWGALPELVEDGQTGYLVPFGDVSAVAGRLIALAEDSELRRKMGLAGRDRAAQGFSGAVVSERLAAVLERIGILGKQPT